MSRDLLSKLESTLAHSNSVHNLREALREALDGLIDLEDQLLSARRAHGESTVTVAVDTRIVELLGEISGKLDTIIDHQRYA